MPEHTSVRLPNGTSQRGEKLAVIMAKLPEYQGFAVSRSRVLTQAILLGLDELEAKHTKSRKK